MSSGFVQHIRTHVWRRKFQLNKQKRKKCARLIQQRERIYFVQRRADNMRTHVRQSKKKNTKIKPFPFIFFLLAVVGCLSNIFLFLLLVMPICFFFCVGVCVCVSLLFLLFSRVRRYIEHAHIPHQWNREKKRLFFIFFFFLNEVQGPAKKRWRRS